MERRRCAAFALLAVKSMLALLVLVPVPGVVLDWGKEAMNSVLLRVGKVKLGEEGEGALAGAEVRMINAGLATEEGRRGLAGVLILVMLVAAYVII